MELMAKMIDRESETFRSLVRSIGGFFSSCATKQTAILNSGFFEISFCAKARSGSQNNDCTYCSQICSSFPCDLVLDLVLTDCIKERESRCICLSTEKALTLVWQRPEGRQLLKSPYYLITALINKEHRFINAWVKVGLPQMMRAEVEEELARWHEDGYQKPTIPLDIFKMLTKGGIPLERSDFGKIHGEEED